MKKIATLILLLYIFNISSLFSQVKNYIPIVKPVLYEKTKETFENIATKFEQKNYNDLAEVFRSFAKGGHGSGFVYVDADGENYIITNRHVVANSEYVNLEFVGKANTKTVYEACPIIYTDNEIDLAIVKFPDNEKVFDKSFSINNNKQLDGQEIWSAGFPGLLGKPLWQFAKGNITNEESYVEQLVDPKVSYLIQHSASIDPGNSGGPLLVSKNEKGVEAYTVIGVNTWTITNRQNTFFAIPSQNFPNLINHAKKIITLQNNKDSLRLLLIKQCQFFAAEINSDKPKWDNVLGNISYAFVGEQGWDSFLEMLKENDEETLKHLESRFFTYSPIEAMRYSILYQIWKRVYASKSKLSVVEYKGISVADEELFSKSKPIRTNFLINGKQQEIEWMFEHGHWRLSNYDFDKNNKVAEKNESSDEDFSEYVAKKRNETLNYFSLSIFTSPYIRFEDKTLDNSFNIIGFGGSVNFTSGRLNVFLRANSLSLNNAMKNPPVTAEKVTAKFLHISHGITIDFLRTKLTPYFLIGLNYTKFTEAGKYKTFTESNEYEYVGSQLGLGLRYKPKKNWSFFCEASYYADSIVPYYSLQDSSYDQLLGNFQVLAGLSFNFTKK